jgi:hypothetical protein
VQHSIPNLAHTMSTVWIEQPTTRAVIWKTKKISARQLKSLNAKKMDFIALDSQPFSVLGDVGFRDWSSVPVLDQHIGVKLDIGAITMLSFLANISRFRYVHRYFVRP